MGKIKVRVTYKPWQRDLCTCRESRHGYNFSLFSINKSRRTRSCVGVQKSMKNFNFIESANNVIKSVSKDLREGNKEYTSISRVLKDIQRKDMLKSGYAAVFEALGLDGGKVTPKDFFEAVPDTMHGTDKKGADFVGLWGWKVTERDKDGKAVEKEPVLRKITSWTPNKVFKVLAQSQQLSK